MAKIIATDGMAPEGVEMLTAAGHSVDVKKVSAEELPKIIGEYDGLVVRSATRATAEVIAAGAPRLKIIGRAGVGVDNIDLKAATQHGVTVVNAPLGNILSAAEHSIAMIFAVARNLPQAHAKLQQGTWDKKSHKGVELHGKTLGVIGLGKIGKHVATVMKGAGMKVFGCDPFLSDAVAEEMGIRKVEMDELVTEADVITLHVPKTEKTANLINAEIIGRMKPTVRIVNVARGGVVNEADLAQALTDGRIAAAACDVFSKEPMTDDNPLIGAPHLITTPHLGASTEEAEVRCATDIADSFAQFFDNGAIVNGVNVQLKVDPAIADYLRAATVLGETLAQAVDAPITGLEVRARGELGRFDVKPLSVAALKGTLSRICEQDVNMVNAQVIAEERGITLTASATETLKDNAARLMLKATTKSGDHVIGGTLVDGQLRILLFEDYPVDLPVGGNLLVMEYPDRPGMVGRYGSILGENNINIARMEVSRIDGRGDALVLLNLDDPVSAEVMDRIGATVKPKRLFTIAVD